MLGQSETVTVDITLKPLSDTRWEAKLDSVKALRYQLGGVLNALENLERESKDGKISSEAHALSTEIQTMEFMTCLVIWNDMLKSHAPAQPCNLPTFRWIQLFC